MSGSTARKAYNLWPITLQNADFKILSKMLEKMALVVKEQIADVQTCTY